MRHFFVVLLSRLKSSFYLYLERFFGEHSSSAPRWLDVQQMVLLNIYFGEEFGIIVPFLGNDFYLTKIDLFWFLRKAFSVSNCLFLSFHSVFVIPPEFGGADERLLSRLAKSEETVVLFGPGNGQTKSHFDTLEFSSGLILLGVPEVNPG